MKSLLPEFGHLLALLKKHNVEFMIVGGYAVIFHGYARTTTDIDIWLKPDNENRNKLISALKEFGINEQGQKQLEKLDFAGVHFFYFGEKPKRIDFLTRISGINYDEASQQMNHFSISGQSVPVIELHHLILSKMSTDRIQDKADVEMLQKINKTKEKKQKRRF